MRTSALTDKVSAWLRDRAHRWAVERAIPFNRATGIRIVKLTADSSDVRLILPLRRSNRNLGGTIHGGVIFAFAETVHGIAALWQLPAFQYAMVTKSARIEFLAPARTSLYVAFGLEPSLREAMRRELAERGRCEIALESTVTDAGERQIARLTATYVIRRNHSPRDHAHARPPDATSGEIEPVSGWRSP